jgi:hypothetical protein
MKKRIAAADLFLLDGKLDISGKVLLMAIELDLFRQCLSGNGGFKRDASDQQQNQKQAAAADP